MSKTQRQNSTDDFVIKTEQRVMTSVPVLDHEIDSIGQMNRVEAIALNFVFAAAGGAIGSAPGAFGSDLSNSTTPQFSRTVLISMIIFFSCIVAAVIGLVFSVISRRSSDKLKVKITKTRNN